MFANIGIHKTTVYFQSAGEFHVSLKRLRARRRQADFVSMGSTHFDTLILPPAASFASLRRRTLQTGQGRPDRAGSRRRQRAAVVHRMPRRPDGSKSLDAPPLLDRDVLSGHTLAVADINADGNLDIFCAEMHTPGPKEKCTAWVLYGDGQGNFQVQQLSVGIGNHDSRVADVNGDGRLDIVTKPYTGHASRGCVAESRQRRNPFDDP